MPLSASFPFLVAVFEFPRKSKFYCASCKILLSTSININQKFSDQWDLSSLNLPQSITDARKVVSKFQPETV